MAQAYLTVRSMESVEVLEMDGYRELDDLLPSVVGVAQRLKEMAAQRPAVFSPSDGSKWVELERASRNAIRAAKGMWLAELQPTSWRDRFWRAARCYWYKKNLIQTLQATEHVLQTSYVSPHIVDVINSLSGAVAAQYFGDLHDENLQLDADQVATSATVKILHLLCLFTFLRMPGPHEGGMTTPNENAKAFARLVTQPPPANTLYKQTITFDTALSAAPKVVKDEFAVHPGWLQNQSSLAKVTKLYVEQLDIKDLASVQRPSKEWFRAAADDDTLGLFRDVLSNCVGALKKDLAIATTAETKILGAIATVLIFLSNVIIHFMVNVAENKWHVEESLIEKIS